MINKKGFTFVEVMVTLSILSVGLVMIFKSYFLAADRMGHLQNRFHANILLDNQISEVERRFRLHGALPLGMKLSQSVDIGPRRVEFEPTIQLKEVDGFPEIFELVLSLSWMEGSRERLLSRSTFISNFKQNERFLREGAE